MRRLNSSTYVPAEPQPGELDPLMEHALTQTLERDVLVPLLQNLAGGLGVFVVIVAVQFWRIDYAQHKTTLDSVLLGALYWGMGAFGVATAYRAFSDECKETLYHWSRGWAEGRTSKELDFLEDEVQRLHMENRQQSAQMAQMVKNVRVSTLTDELPLAKPRVVEDEYTEPLRDALALCRFQEAHGRISRDTVIDAGVMNREQWGIARRLLASANVPVVNGAITMTPAIAMSKVREFVSKQRQAPSDFVLPFEQ